MKILYKLEYAMGILAMMIAGILVLLISAIFFWVSLLKKDVDDETVESEEYYRRKRWE